MADLILRARLRRRDRVLREAIKRMALEEGELADMIREGLTLILSQRGALRPVESLPAITAQQVARELMSSIKLERSGC